MLIDLVAFTINLAVLNEPVMKDFQQTVRRIYSRGYTGNVAELLSGTWTSRIGQLLPKGVLPPGSPLDTSDKWWGFRSSEAAEPVVSSVLDALERFALPRIEVEMDRPLTEPAFIVLVDDEETETARKVSSADGRPTDPLDRDQRRAIATDLRLCETRGIPGQGIPLAAVRDWRRVRATQQRLPPQRRSASVHRPARFSVRDAPRAESPTPGPPK